MPEAARKGDICTGHSCFAPRQNDKASDNVYVNSRGWHRQTDHWVTHGCGDSSHDSKLSRGSSTVYVNNLQAGRIGDPVKCGSAVATGSGNVFAGG